MGITRDFLYRIIFAFLTSFIFFSFSMKLIGLALVTKLAILYHNIIIKPFFFFSYILSEDLELRRSSIIVFPTPVPGGVYKTYYPTLESLRPNVILSFLRFARLLSISMYFSHTSYSFPYRFQNSANSRSTSLCPAFVLGSPMNVVYNFNLFTRYASVRI